MRFLRTLLLILLAVGLVIFAMANWHDVMIDIGADLRMAIKLPLLLVLVFLAGLVPPILYYRAKMWKLNRRVEQAQRALDATPRTPPPPSRPAPEPNSPF